jgi:hypothetical protein
MPWTFCTVERAGPAEDGVVYIALRSTDGAFNHWFQAEPSIKKEMLATALVAISTDKNVHAAVTDVTEYSTIQRLYVQR